MNKMQLANRVAKRTGLSVAKSLEAINAIFSADPREGIIAEELDAGRKVTIPGFGTFSTKKRAARLGTNPATGTKVQVASKRGVVFKSGKQLTAFIDDDNYDGVRPGSGPGVGNDGDG